MGRLPLSVLTAVALVASLLALTPGEAHTQEQGQAEGQGQVEGQDLSPVLSVSAASLTEDAANMEFTVALAPAGTQTVTVAYATSDGTAAAGADYTAASGTLTFAVGDTAETVAVAVLEDGLDETDETFTLTLSSPTNAVLHGGGDTLDATGTIADDDASPVFADVSVARSVAENSAAGASVGAALPAAGDADGDELSYTMGGADAGSFDFDPASRQITVAAATMLDFEAAKNTYTITITASDGANSGALTVNITVTDANDAPVFTSLSAVSVPENTTAVTTVTAADADVGDAVTGYTITGGADSSKFTITSGGVLAFNTAPDYESPTDAESTSPANAAGNNEYLVEVTATSGTGARAMTAAQTIVVTVTDADEARRNLAYMRPVTASDVYGSDPNWNGDKAVDETDTTRWATSDGLTAATLTVDLDGEQTFDRIVIKEPPDQFHRVTGYTLQHWDGTAWADIETGTTIGNARTHTFTAVTGTRVRLSITSVAGQRGPTIAEFQVWNDANEANEDDTNEDDTNDAKEDDAKEDDANEDDTNDAKEDDAKEDDANAAPVFTSPSAVSVAENTTAVTTVVASDADSTDSVTGYAITGGADSSKFTITSGGGVLAFKAAPDYESPTDTESTSPANAAANNEYIVEVTATSGTGARALTAAQTITVTVTDATEPSSQCVSTDTALLGQVEAMTQDPWNGARPDLLEMFTRAHNTMKGTDTYTTWDIRARPDKQGEEWQGEGPDELWQSVYLELDFLEACRSRSRQVQGVTVSFGARVFRVDEVDDPTTQSVREDQVMVSVVLDADPGRTVTVPITVTNQGGATGSDYSGVPASVTFNSGETSKSFTFTAAGDTGEIGESVLLGFGTLPTGVTEGSQARAVVTIGARRVLQAHEYDGKSGSVTPNDKAPDYSSVGGIAAGDWIRFDDVRIVGSPDLLMVSLAAAAGDAGDTIEVRLNSASGTRVAELTIASTGGAERFDEQFASVAGLSPGVHDIYFVFPTATGANINWFVFSDDPGDAGVVTMGGRPVLQAHQFDAKHGTVAANTVLPDGSSVGSIGAGDWLRFDDVSIVGTPDVFMVSLGASSADANDRIEVRLNSETGTKVAELTIYDTGGRSRFDERYAHVSGLSPGVHDLYFVFPSATGANISWFVFTDNSEDDDPQYETEDEFDARMKWWRDAKFGMFIHWGAYSHLAGHWNTCDNAEWIMQGCSISISDYESRAAAQLNPTHFDAAAWAKLAKDAGQKYVVITSKHHDGFSMFDTNVRGFTTQNFNPGTSYDIVDIGGWGRDPIAELAEAVRAEGLVFGVYYSMWDWHFTFDETPNADYLPAMKEQLRELVEKFDPALFWFDGEWTRLWTREIGEATYKYLRTLKPDVIINDRVVERRIHQYGDGDYDTTGERESPKVPWLDWEYAQVINDNWGYVDNDFYWKSNSKLVRDIFTNVSNNGNYLLNISPTGPGVVPKGNTDALKAIGDWLKIHGPAIYGAKKPNPLKFSRPSWGWYITAGQTVYAGVKNWPSGGRLVLENLDSKVTKVTVMGTPDTTYRFHTVRGQTIVTGLPSTAPNNLLPVLVLTIAGKVQGHHNLALNRPVTVSSQAAHRTEETDTRFSAVRAVDSGTGSGWASANGPVWGGIDNTPTLTVTLDGPQTFNRIALREPHLQRDIDVQRNVRGFKVQYRDGSSWVDLGSGTTIGDLTHLTFPPVTSSQVRLVITSAAGHSGGVTIMELEVWNDPPQSLAYNRQVMAPSNRRDTGNVVDENDSTHWTAASGIATTHLTVRLDGTQTFNRIVIKEASQRVTSYMMQYHDGSSWVDLDTGTTIGTEKTITFDPVSSDRVRLRITGASDSPSISEIEVWNDVRGVSADFSAETYSTAEGSSASVTVSLSDDPARTVVVPITVTNRGGATGSDYSGVPTSVTFNRGETSKTFTFTAVDDDIDDDGESVLLGFGTLPAAVDRGATPETVIDVTDDDSSPVFAPATATRSVPENSPAGTAVGAALPVASDADSGDVVSYTMGGADAGAFDFDAGTRQITVAAGAVLDFEASKNTHTVTVTADDGHSNTAVLTVTISVTDVNERPSAPREVFVSPGNRTLAVAWQPPEVGATTVSGFTLQHRAASAAAWTTVAKAAADRSHTVSGLTNGTVYEVRVRAVNTVGDGEWSAAVSAAPSASASAPGAPREVSLTPGDRTLAVRWQPPASDGGSAVSGYRVHLRGNCSGAWIMRPLQGTAARSHTMGTLTNGTTYCVRVAAVNAQGITYSASASAAPTSAPGAPSAPRGVSVAEGDRMLEVRWLPPASDGGSAVSGYRVQHKAASAQTWTTVGRGAADRARTISGLTNNTAYEVRVAAVNAQGAGAYSASAPATPRATVALVVGSSSIDESGASNATTVRATLPVAVSSPVVVTLAVEPASGVVSLGGSTLTIPANMTQSAAVTVTAVDNSADDDDATAVVSGTTTSTAVAAVAPVALTVADDDPPPVVSVDSPSVTEGGALSFEVTLSAASGRTVTVAYADAGTGTATAGSDYGTVTAGTVTFAPGDTTETVTVQTTEDSLDEPDETVVLRLSSPANATLHGGGAALDATGTVADDDPPPVVSVDSPSVAEGDSGSASLSFEVTLSAASGRTVTVAYADAGTGTATAGSDYGTVTAGTVTFAAGDTTRTVTVSVTGDELDEGDKTVVLRLSSPTHATLAGGVAALDAEGTITDDDSSPVFSPATAARSVPENSPAGAAVGAPLPAAPDADSGDVVTYTMAGADAGSFDFDAGTRQITVKTGTTLDFEASKNTYTVTVTADDGNSNTAMLTVTISVTDVNEAPVFTSAAAFSAPENTTAVTTVAADDVDSGDSVTGYSITGGADRAKFAITSPGGELTFNTAPDYESPTDAASTNPNNAAQNNQYVVEVTATSGAAGRQMTAAQTIVVTVTDANEAPEFTSAATATAAENTTAVATVVADDLDSADSVTGYAVTGGADRAKFTITSPGGELTFNTAPDYESPTDAASTNPTNAAQNNQYLVEVTATSGTSGRQMTAAQTIVVTVTDVNEAPEFTTGAAVDVIENTTAVTTVVAADADSGDSVTGYSVTGGADQAKFTITSPGGELTFNTAPDYESPTDAASTNPTNAAQNNQYVVEVTATSGAGSRAMTAAQTITVTVTDANEAPTFTSATTATVAENTTAVATVTASDIDSGDSVTAYAITGGADQAKFTITSPGGALTFNTAPDYESPTDAASTNPNNAAQNNQYVVVVTATSGTAGRQMTAAQTIVVTVTDANEAPEFTSAATATAAENTTTVATVVADDVDSADSVTAYAITGGADQAKFTITSPGGELTFNTAPDYESPTDAASTNPNNAAQNNQYVVVVTATSGTAGRQMTAAQTIVVTVTDANEAPEFTSAATATAAENTTTVATVVADDLDSADSVTGYSITGGADQAKFTITSPGGELTFNTAPDYESPTDAASTNPTNAAQNNQYLVEVTATSGTSGRELTAAQTIVVTVTDANEAPEFTTGAAVDVIENTTAVTTVVAADADSGDSVTGYSVTGGADSSKFTITSPGGELTFNTAPDYESPTDAASTNPNNAAQNNQYLVEVTATSGTSGRQMTAAQTITVTVTDANEAPTFTSATTATVAENTTAVATVTASDIDSGDSVTAYAITGGADQTKFTITSPGGALTFNTAPDYESPTDAESTTPANAAANNQYVVEVTATSGAGARAMTAAQTITVTVTDANEAPTFTSAATATTAENTTAVATVVADDPDSGDSVTAYAITGGADQTKFTITSPGGELTFNTAPDYESPTDAESSDPANAAANNQYVVEVTATSGAGARAMRATQTIVVTVTDNTNEPDAPTGLSTTATATSLEVGWTAPSNAGRPAVTGYDVQYRAGSAGDWSFGPQGVAVTSATVTGLWSNTAYQIRVRASNAEGDGAWSDAVSATTAEPTVSVDSPSVAEGDSGAVSLTFTVTLSAPSGRAVTVGYADTDRGSATSGVDYSAVAAGTVTFSPGDTAVPVSVSVIGDAVVEGNETVVLRLSSPAGAVFDGGRAALDAVGTVADDEQANNPPGFVSSVASRRVAENSPPGAAVGAALPAAVDADGDVLVYSMGGADAGLFDFDASTRRIAVAAGTVLDYESRSRYTVSVSVTDNKAPSGAADDAADDAVAVTIWVVDIDEPGAVGLSSPQPQAGTELTASLSDGDGAPAGVVWVWERSTDRTAWTVIADEADAGYTPGAADVGSYLRASAAYSDPHGADKAAAAVSADPVRAAPATNGPPVFADGATTGRQVAENAAAGNNVGAPVAASDPDRDAVAYSLSGRDAQHFEISGTGQITVAAGAVLDYESRSRYSVTARAADPSGESDTIRVDVTVTDVDGEAPSRPARPRVAARTTTSVSVRWAEPPNAGPRISRYDLQHRAVGAADWSTATASGASAAIAGLAPGTDYELRVRAVNAEGESQWSDTAVAATRQAANRAPAFAHATAQRSLKENLPAGSAAGAAVTATDPDGDALTYTIAGSPAFTVNADSGQLNTTAALSHETADSHTVTVTATDGSLSASIKVTVTVHDTEEPGSVTLSAPPQVSAPVTAWIADPDGAVDAVNWVWELSTDKTNWEPIASAAGSVHTPEATDEGMWLRAAATYTDRRGPDKTAHSTPRTVAPADAADRPATVFTLDPDAAGDVTLLISVGASAPEGTTLILPAAVADRLTGADTQIRIRGADPAEVTETQAPPQGFTLPDGATTVDIGGAVLLAGETATVCLPAGRGETTILHYGATARWTELTNPRTETRDGIRLVCAQTDSFSLFATATVPAAPGQVGDRAPEAPETASPFTDIDDAATDAHRDDIARLHALGIARGVTQTLYAPHRNVTRAQTASFLARLYQTVIRRGAPLPAAVPFTDIDDAAVHRDDIARLHALGVARGVTQTLYAPHRNVTRAQTASFLTRLYRALTGQDAPLPAAVPFTDIDDAATDAHRDDIARLYALGVARGVTDTQYAPHRNVTRAQMASFLIRIHQAILQAR